MTNNWKGLNLDTNIDPSEVPKRTPQDQTGTVPDQALIRTGILSKPAEAGTPQIPAYLRERYNWAYLNPRNAKFLDHESVVAAILWGNHNRLQQSVFSEIQPGQQVLQPACVYGKFSVALARHIGPHGLLQVSDVAPLQVERCRYKLRDFPQAKVRLADAARPCGEFYDRVCCYFLLHEMPSDDRRKTVDALLGSLPPGGTAIFVDYHKPFIAHPLKVIMGLVFNFLEPFAKDLWHDEIVDFASAPDNFVWCKQTYFGGLYQKVTAHRPEAPLL